MEIAAILALVTKGVLLADALIQAGKSATPAIDAIKGLVMRGRTKPPTREEMDKTDAVLDALIDEFNVDLPPE